MRNRAKWFWLLALVLLVSCGGSGPSPSLGETPEIKGKVQNWSGSSGEVLAVNFGDQILGKGTIQSDGGFRVRLYSVARDLPNALAEISLSDSKETCSIHVSPSGVRWTLVSFLEGPEGEIVGLLNDPEAPDQFGQLIYVDSDVTIRSEGECYITWDLDLKAGWNWIVYTINDDGEVMESKYPSGLRWYLLH